MTTDLTVLAWVAALTALMWLPYIAPRAQLFGGLVKTLSYMNDDDPVPAWMTRAKRAHHNAVENLAPFAALVLVAHVTLSNNGTTAACSVIYLLARLAHYVVYIAGVPFGRTITFAIGWVAMMIIFLNIVT